LHRTIVELARIRPGERILDVGCGPGRLAVVAGTAAGPEGEICGIDPASEMIELARRGAAQGGVPARFEVGVIEALLTRRRLSEDGGVLLGARLDVRPSPGIRSWLGGEACRMHRQR
jgi:predicted RNA methylase